MKHLIVIICLVFVSTVVKAQQLESYIQEAELNNLEIQSFILRHSISKEKIEEGNAIPNTQISAGYFVSEPETRTGAQRARFSIKQMLPWFGTITARENYSSAIAEAEYTDIVIVKRKLALAISQSYYELSAIHSKHRILNENILLLQTYEKLALTSVEVGKASAVDVLRLQIKLNELEQHKKVHAQGIDAEQTTFNSLLNRKYDIDIGVPLLKEIPSEDPIINEDGLKLNPELLKYDKLYESVHQSELLNQKESAPQIGFGLDYIPVSERRDISLSDNGKDIIMPQISLSIPIFNKKYKSKSLQNELRQKEIKAQKDERFHRLASLLAKAVSERNTARIKNETQIENLKRAKNAEEILIKSYETGTVNFNDILDILELQLKFQLNQIENIKQYYIQTAIINYLTN
ncbi:TolC family protein [Aquimarina sediminis]|uniref:TolC family protein n=1 Tax=Aquimarina sediminis TaxID=2070536 RepID=UPI000CA0444A|nr:TolC family protein [Aquimarina sediminis]